MLNPCFYLLEMYILKSNSKQGLSALALFLLLIAQVELMETKIIYGKQSMQLKGIKP